jgi:DNA-binding response OmpR family regulator
VGGKIFMDKAKGKILIIDDEANLVNFLRLHLEKHKFQVISADDGDIGLAKAKSEKPDLIVLDLNLPNLGGFWVCKALKSQEEYKNIPIIIITGAYVSEEDQKQALELGAQAYLEKPFKTKVLINKIEEILNLV